MRITLLLFFIAQFVSLNAQNNPEKNNSKIISLSELLITLEKIHDVRFSYEPKLIQNKKLKLNPHATALADILKQVEDSLHITCKKIDKRYYILASDYENMLLKGYVIDKIGGTPINGANIINLRTGKGTVSMQNGSFSIESNHQGDSVSISFVGYETLVTNTDIQPPSKNTSFFFYPQ
jgi:hypothetical protein